MGQAPKGDTYNTDGDGFPLVAGAGDFGDLYPQPKKFTTASNARICEPGDVIVGIRASIGDKVLADDRYCLGRGVAGLRATPAIDSRFLWHWVTFSAPMLRSKGRGATFLQVNKKDVAEQEIDLPPIEEQRRIAAVLDAADALRAKRRQAIAKLDTLTQSIFIDMFGGPAEADRWPTSQLGSVVADGTKVTYGIVQAGDEFDGGVPYVRTGDIVGGKISVDGLRRTDPAIAKKFPRSQLAEGDIVMSIRATVGTTALATHELDGANLTQGTARISPGHLVTSTYLLECLRAERSQRWIARQVKGATFREITLGRLRERPVQVPPMDLQLSFGERASSTSRSQEQMSRQLADSDELFASLQQRAFRGEL